MSDSIILLNERGCILQMRKEKWAIVKYNGGQFIIVSIFDTEEDARTHCLYMEGERRFLWDLSRRYYEDEVLPPIFAVASIPDMEMLEAVDQLKYRDLEQEREEYEEYLSKLPSVDVSTDIEEDEDLPF